MKKRAAPADEISENLMESLRGKSFESVFHEEVDKRSGATRFRIKRSGVRGRPTDARLTEAVVRALANHGVAVKQYSMGSPANVDSFHLAAQFQDGGLEASTGAYMFSPRGAWVRGTNAVTWVAQLLGLRPQKQLKSRS